MRRDRRKRRKHQRLQRPQIHKILTYSLICPICLEPKRLADVICNACKTQLDSECFDSFMSRCPVCHRPKVDDLYACQACISEPGYEVFSVARYDGKLSYSVIDSFKFHGHKQMARVVALYLNRALDALDPEGEALVVPIPCSAARISRFGWDQMVEVCRFLNRPFLQILDNSDSSRLQQKKMDRAHRIESSSKRFKIREDCLAVLPKLSDRKIIVVDDIVTTMGTVRSAIAVLKENGIKYVAGASWLFET